MVKQKRQHGPGRGIETYALKANLQKKATATTIGETLGQTTLPENPRAKKTHS